MSRSKADTKFARLKWRRAFRNWELKAARWIEAIKAGYDPNQPRVPAGNSDGGQWTNGGGSDSGPVLSDANPDNFWKPGTRLAQANPNRPKKPKRPGIGHNAGPPLEPPPDIPKRKPPTHKERLSVARRIARWITAAAAGRYVRALILAEDVLEKAGWMDEFRGFIKSAFDPPKSLEQLQKDASKPTPGYDIHHIVEQTAARRAGFPDSLINAPENLVRIPRIRHWELNRWFAKKNEKFGMRSPREYLRDKDWEERVRVGREALIEIGVLKK